MNKAYGLCWDANEKGRFPIYKNVKSIREVSIPLLGVTKHGVFMDSHFEGNNHLVKITHIESGEVLPITNEDGSIGDYLQGNLWVNWNFRVKGAAIDQDKLKAGIRSYTAFWMKQEKHSMSKPQSFVIHAKYIPAPSGWEKDYYSHSLKGEWIEVGQAQWVDKVFTSAIEDIESTVTSEF